MKNKQIAIGMETLYNDRESNLTAKFGAILPKIIPATIQIKTQIVRNFSKMLSFFCLLILVLSYS